MNFIQLILLIIILPASFCKAQQLDSSLIYLQKLPEKYFASIDQKIDKYTNRITGKTIKTLTKLSRWEKKIQSVLEKINPETASNLFGPGKTTFTYLLQKLKEGQAITEEYRSQYNEYRDKLNTSLRYLHNQKEKISSNIGAIKVTARKMNELEKKITSTEAIEQFIKERKQQLIDAAIKYLGKNKYLHKISKEAYYYAETLKNYKEIFSSPEKIEKATTELLTKIPAFNDFMENNSGLSSLFGNSLGGGSGITNSTTNYAALGYQSNTAIIQSLQQRNISGPSIQQLTQISTVALNSPLQELKDHFPGSSSTAEMPDFKPNEMKSQTFKQRLQFGTSLQFGRATNFLPGTAEVGLQLAYKLNTKSSAGIGTAFKLGLGTGISNIKLSFGGLGLRSFIDWKLKAKVFVNGGFEFNYYKGSMFLRDMTGSNNNSASMWKPAALIGINKKYSLGKMKGNLMILYDFLAKQKLPQTSAFVFRFGYNF